MSDDNSELISEVANALAAFRSPVTTVDALAGEYTVRAHELVNSLTARGYAVVKLPEPCFEDDDGQLYFDDGDIRVDTTGSNEWPRLYVNRTDVDPDRMRAGAAEMLAAANEADAAYAAAER